jgi:hypothetical protein
MPNMKSDIAGNRPEVHDASFLGSGCRVEIVEHVIDKLPIGWVFSFS